MTTHTRTYGAFGAHTPRPGVARTAYTGAVREADTGWYLLGERPFSDTLRRFIAPDPASPLGEGGINRYAYCGGDPINRVDRSGHSWWAWLAAMTGHRGTTGAARAISDIERGTHEGVSTPTTMSATAASVTDLVSVTSAIEPTRTATSGGPKVDDLFGRARGGAATTSGGSTLPPARNGSPTRQFFGQTHGSRPNRPAAAEPIRTVELVTDPNVPEDRAYTNRYGYQVVRAGFTYGYHHANPQSMVMASDSSVRTTDLRKVAEGLSILGITEATLFAGAHGETYGRNWDTHTQQRLYTEPQFFHAAKKYGVAMAAKEGVTLKVRYVGHYTRPQLAAALKEDGVHVVYGCFGIADPVVMEALNYSNVVVYQRRLYA